MTTNLKVKIFADIADKKSMLDLYQHPLVKGFTTNPSLLRKAGVQDYKAYAKEIIKLMPDRPFSFEVFADDFAGMQAQALEIASWGKNVYVKIPVMNTQRTSSLLLIQALARAGVKQNVTAIMTMQQVEAVTHALANGPSAFISVFAGRIADTGRDPLPIMRATVEMIKPYENLELIWASSREIYNVFQADEIGCHIITVMPDLIHKMHVVGKDLDAFSLETVKIFYEDAVASGLSLASTEPALETV